MTTDNKKQYTCKPDTNETLEWDNSAGIAPPSETAKSLMNEEGYDEQAGPIQNDVAVDHPQR